MTEMDLPLVLSLRPHYADMVFVGTKKAELRRRMASVVENRPVFVYVTSPVREIRGGFHVGKVWKGTPEFIWQSVSSLVPMDKAEFDSYFSGCDVGVALEIDRVWEYGRPIPLGELAETSGRVCCSSIVEIPEKVGAGVFGDNGQRTYSVDLRLNNTTFR